MQIFFVIPPTSMWFQDDQTGRAFLWLLGAFVLIALVFLIAWMAARRTKAKEREMDEIARSQINSPISGAIPTTGVETTVPGEVKEIGSAVISAPPDETAIETEFRRKGDDLSRIEGIGPAMQGVLNEAGIFTYEKLAQSDPVILKHMLMDAQLDYIDPTHWPEQARLASLGHWEELEEVKRQIRGQNG